MERAAAVTILDRPHDGQNAFYAGGEEQALRALPDPDSPPSPTAAQHAWSTVGLYAIADRLTIPACRLLPFDQTTFDAIWSS